MWVVPVESLADGRSGARLLDRAWVRTGWCGEIVMGCMVLDGFGRSHTDASHITSALLALSTFDWSYHDGIVFFLPKP